MRDSVAAVPPAPVRVPSQRPLIPSVTSITPIKVIPGAVPRTPDVYIMAEENPSNGVPCLQMNLVGSNSTSRTEKEVKKERAGSESESLC